MIRLTTELKQIRGINNRLLAHINHLGIVTVQDLILHFPSRYEDFSAVIKIGDLNVNQTATIQGVIQQIETRRTWQKRMLIVEAHVQDETGSIKAVWFNQPYIARILQPGRIVNLAGKVVYSQDEICLSNPIYETISQYGAETKHTAGLIPIYPETKGLTSKGLRYLIKPILNNLEKLIDFLPAPILKKFDLPEINLALRIIHFPSKMADAELAKKRFAFEDLFLLQINNLQMKSRLAKEKAAPIKIEKEFLETIVKKLPFVLTASQQQSLKEILTDLQKPNPMNRLLQGDVGSGKTVIAAIAALIVARNNKQSALMVPTEVLAKQHYKTIIKLFGYLAMPMGILTNSQCRCFYGEGLESETKKTDFEKKIADGELKLVIGTHALIAQRKKDDQKKSLEKHSIVFRDLVFVAIDEQHRFGVEQRAALIRNNESGIRNPADAPQSGALAGRQESGVTNKEFKKPLISYSRFIIPHFLSMSATPIPRTLSLTIFGDLELSTITELPVGRKAIITKIVAPTNRDKAYQFVREQIQKGRQAFVICPRIEIGEQETGNRKQDLFTRHPTPDTRHSWMDVKAVKAEYEKLSAKIFPDLKIAMLHGKLKSEEKNQIMNDFMENKINILVATSVIEVGVDVPNASIMIIEGADRFGLAQLYQFRGRVGRAEHQSFCLLFTDSTAATTNQRLKSLLEAKNGFELAEKDLAIRGPGQFVGHTQTGMPDLLMRSLNNMELIKETRLAAMEILKKERELEAYPLLKAELAKFKQRVHLE